MSAEESVSRRGFLFGRRPKPATAEASPSASKPGNPTPPPEAPKRAVIQGRHCLAYRNLDCSVCHERCPEPGAIVVERGIPSVVPSLCTGCKVCFDVCPAPGNAILMLPPPPKRPTSDV